MSESACLLSSCVIGWARGDPAIFCVRPVASSLLAMAPHRSSRSLRRAARSANGWWRNKKDKAINVDLWGRLLDLCAQHEVTFEWVKGHAGHSENERCDELAVLAAQGIDLPADGGYESENPTDISEVVK